MEFYRGIRTGSDTFVGAERADVPSPDRGQVKAGATSGKASACRFAGEITGAVRLALKGKENKVTGLSRVIWVFAKTGCC